MNLSKKNITIGILIIILLWCISAILISTLIDEPSNRGVFGDMFGAINALFSGLALFGVIVSILIQQRELIETKNEFKTNRLTNILFKKIEYLNSIVNRVEFKLSKKDAANMTINEFIHFLTDNYKEDFSSNISEVPNNVEFSEFWDLNESNVKWIIEQVDTTFSAFSRLLNSNLGNDKESLQLKRLLADNLNPKIFELLKVQLKTIIPKRKYEENHSVWFLKVQFIESDVKRIMNILNYGGRARFSYNIDRDEKSVSFSFSG